MQFLQPPTQPLTPGALPGVDGESLRLWFFDSGGNHPDPKIRRLGSWKSVT